jgi:hypothetical protein
VPPTALIEVSDWERVRFGLLTRPIGEDQNALRNEIRPRYFQPRYIKSLTYIHVRRVEGIKVLFSHFFICCINFVPKIPSN